MVLLAITLCQKRFYLLISRGLKEYNNSSVMPKDYKMERHLNLVESDFEQLKKIVLPRFPFCYLTFKFSNEEHHVFEVKDISHSGMQLSLKEGTHNIKENEKIHGYLRWGGTELEITGSVKWHTSMRLGIEFSTQVSTREEIDQLLDLAQVAKFMKPVHKFDFAEEVSASLKYWLRADGPVEIFVWRHNDGELSKFQILMMENFVEWEDVKGLKTARVISKRDIDTPLISEDEIVLKVDEVRDDTKIKKATTLINSLDVDLMTANVIDFIKMKIRS
jgi:hypothetical protein